LFLRIAAAAILIFAPQFVAAQDTKPAADKKSDAKTDEVYTAGGDVKPPKVLHYVEPDFSASSQEAYVEGVVRLSAIVNLDGQPSDLKVIAGLNAEEDKTALAALQQWRFKPGTKNDKPVRVRITVEINFHLL
jgi:TonB family protein